RLTAFFASIPYDLENKAEKHYQTVFYLLFSLMGQIVKVEPHSAVGRADAVVELPDAVYIFEFKIDGNGTAEDALQQIDKRGYATPYAASGKRIVKVGAVFDVETRTIGRWLVA
ncbi:MAG: PD-(D/E)XK nuclease domain-containing protein, partial [Prevotellaceae bacterium]|nr:PD-(D/E)XK nuclease domain-containing protein [Prevotellaceae bacterium]